MAGQLEMFAVAGLTEPPDLPPLDVFDAHPVTWREWDGVPASLCANAGWMCGHCGNQWPGDPDGNGDQGNRPFITFGLLDGMIRLVAYWCGRCGRCEVLDKHRDHRQVWVGLLTAGTVPAG